MRVKKENNRVEKFVEIIITHVGITNLIKIFTKKLFFITKEIFFN